MRLCANYTIANTDCILFSTPTNIAKGGVKKRPSGTRKKPAADPATSAAGFDPLYEEGLRLMRLLRNSAVIQSFTLEHVYREYNSQADGVANQVLTNYSHVLHRSGVVVDANWTQMHVPSATIVQNSSA